MINVDDTLEKFEARFLQDGGESAILIKSCDKIRFYWLTLLAYMHSAGACSPFMPSVTVMWMILFMQISHIILNKSELSAEKSWSYCTSETHGGAFYSLRWASRAALTVNCASINWRGKKVYVERRFSRCVRTFFPRTRAQQKDSPEFFPSRLQLRHIKKSIYTHFYYEISLPSYSRKDDDDGLCRMRWMRIHV